MTAGAIMPDTMPDTYDDDWFREKIEEKKKDLQKLSVTYTDPDTQQEMTQDMVFVDAERIDDLTPYTRAKPGGGGGKDTGPGGADWAYKAADDNALGNQARHFYGGIYHPDTGTFSGLSKTERSEVVAIHAHAAKLYRQAKGQISHAEAFRQAAADLGIPLPDPSNKLATDPAGILTGP